MGEAEENKYVSKYANYVRHYKEAGWTYEKVSRMAVYVFLFNKVRGMPKAFGLSNDSVSCQFNEYIREHFVELCQKYDIPNHVPGLDLSGDHYDENGKRVKGGATTFVEELNEYSQYALTLSGVNPDNVKNGRIHMASDDDMVGLIEAFTADRKKHFELIRANTKKDSGYNLSKDGKNKIGILRAEKYKVTKQIEEQKKKMRETALFGSLKGVGFLAFGGVAVTSALVLFAPFTGFLGATALATSSVGRIAVGLTGLIIGGSSASRFGRGFLKSCAKFFGQFMHLRQDLKEKHGEYGKRGLKDIQKSIDLNEAVKCAYSVFEKMVKEVTYYKRQPGTGVMLDKDGNPIQFQNENELVASNGAVYKFDKNKRTLTGPNGAVLRLGMNGKIFDVENKPVEIEGLQVPYIEAIQQKVPTKEEFIYNLENWDKIYKNKEGKPDKQTYKMLLPLLKADESDSEFGKLWDRVKERWGYLYGPARKTTSFVSTFKTVVEDNSEIVLEREDFYNSVFNISFEVDVKNPERPPVGLDVDESKIDFTKYPSFDKNSKHFVYEYNTNISVNDFLQALIELRDDEERYKRHEEMIKYNHYKTRASDMLPVIFQRELFDRPLTGVVIRNCTELLNNDLVKQTLIRNNTGDKTSYVNSAIRFLISEQIDPKNKIRTDLGVTLADQLCASSADGIEKACLNSLGLASGSPDFDLVKNTIAPLIENMQFKEEATAILTYVNNISDEKTREYLKQMVENRQNQVMHSKNHVVANITNNDPTLASDPDIINIATILSSLKYDSANDTFTATVGTTNYTEAQVRQMISQLDENVRARAEQMLSTQCESLERGHIDGIRLQAAKAVRSNSMSVNIEPLLTYIEELKFENLGTDELTQFLIEKVKKVQPPEMGEYLRNKLRVKVEELYKFRFAQGGLYTGENAMKELTTDLQKLERMQGILGTARKERILKLFEPRVGIAFDKMLTLKERFLFEMGNLDDFMKEIEVIRKQPYDSGGFKQFFERNSTESDKIVNRLERIQTILRYSSELNGTGKSGISIQTDAKVPESKIFLGIFFKRNRNDSDQLLAGIKKVNNLVDQVDFTKFGVEEGNVGNCRGEIQKLHQFLDDTSPTANLKDSYNPTLVTDPGDKATEQIAALLIYKRKVLALFKSHLKKLTYGKHDVQAYIRSAEGQKVIAKIDREWRGLLQDIDNKYEELMKEAVKHGNDKLFSGFAYKKATATLDAAISETNIMNYVLSSDSVVMDRG